MACTRSHLEAGHGLDCLYAYDWDLVHDASCHGSFNQDANILIKLSLLAEGIERIANDL